MDEATIRALMALQAIPEDQARLQDQIGRGEALYGMPGAQGMQVGGTYRASSPLEHLAVMLNRGLGARRIRQGEQAQQANVAALGAGRNAAMAEVLRRMLSGEQETTQPAAGYETLRSPSPWI